MRAVKLWSSASQEERQKSGNPPTNWVKESIYFVDQKSVPYFESLGYIVMTDDEFAQYLLANQSSFENYINTGYAQVQSFNAAFNENELKIRKGKEILLRFKLKNLSEGITWAQAVWLHHRVKNWVVNVNGVGPIEVDLYNVLNSGDLESAVYMILSGNPDDMTKPYHWVTPQRMQWVAKEIQKELQDI